MQLIAGILIGLLLIGLGPLLLLISLRWLTADDVTDRLEEFTGTRSDQRSRRLQNLYATRMGLTGTLVERTFIPFIRRLAKFLGRFTPAQALREVDHRLVLAGQPMGLGAREFFGIRFIFMLFGLFLAFVLLRMGRSTMHLVGAGSSVFIGFLFPIVWLRRLIRDRQKEILRGLPDALDMLSVCASAGLGFDQSMQRVSEFWQTTMGTELGRVIAEMEMGISRREALRNLAARTEVTELSSFVSLIVQAEQLGMSISHTITSMADQMRIERRFRAQEEARKLPNKILFPLVFFIFPSMIAVILGPSLPAIVDLFAYLGR
jgi:tight adherence protein C